MCRRVWLTLVLVTALVSAVLILPVAALPSTAAAAARTADFTVRGSQIIDPDGRNFIPVGANVNGPQFVWNGPTVGQAAVADDVWHWNTIRVNTCWDSGCENGSGWHWPNNDDLDAIISQYTARKIVVMIDLQQFMPGQYPSAAEMTRITAWWTDVANRYKGNPYVWFNLLNEPGDGGQQILPQWNSVTTDLTRAIRSTGSTNIIVADGAQYGQEAYDWRCGSMPYANSAILTYGRTLQSTYGNMVFSLHVYSEWGGGSTGCTNAQLDRRLSDFIDRVHGQSLPLIIGETGTYPQASSEQWWEKGQTPATRSAFRVAPNRDVGILPWHGDRGAGYLFAKSGSWSDVTSRQNLTWMGRALWDYAHSVT